MEHESAFPGHPGRGLIEASDEEFDRIMLEEMASPVIQAGASLKQLMKTDGNAWNKVAFPGHPGRGLIEASSSRNIPYLLM